MNASKKNRPDIYRYGFSIAGIVFLVVIWWILSLTMSSLIIASPLATLRAGIRMAGTPDFRRHLLFTIERIFSGVITGGAAGFVFGVVAGLNRYIRAFLEPLRWMLMSVPAVVVVVIAMLWFGMGSTMVVFITALLLAPVVYVNIVEGLSMVDDTLLEMAHVYRFPMLMKIKHLYLPAIFSNLVSSFMLIIGNGVRIVILAEVMGTAEGVGYALSLSRTNLDIPGLFMWIIICVLLVGLTETLIIHPVRRRLLAWRKTSS